MYCFSVSFPSEAFVFMCMSSERSEAEGRPRASPSIPRSAASTLSMAEADSNSASSERALSSGFRGSVPIARSSENLLSALRRKYPNMMDAAYICAACSLDVRTSALP